jgi:hypothetical protein
MTRPVVGLICLTALLTILYASERAQADQAVVVREGWCGLLDGDGGIASGEGVFLMSNAGGVSTLRCSLDDVPNSTGRAVHWNYENTGMSCMTTEGTTTDWHETVSAAGRATLVCRHTE